MEQYDPSQNLVPASKPKKNILLWFLVIFAALALVFFSISYVKKFVEQNKAEKQSQQAEQKDLLPDLVCNFSSDTEASQKALEEKNISACLCIQDEQVKFRCWEDAQNEAYYAQARAQFDGKLCERIKNNSFIKDACEKMVISGIEYLKKQNPEYLANTFLQNGNYDGAITVLQGSEKVSSMLSLALSYAGKALNEHKEAELIPKAQELIEKAKTLEPNNPEVYRAEGYVYEIRPNLIKAVESYSKALEINPGYLLALTGRAHTYNMQGILESALNDFKKAAELDKNKEQMIIYTNLCRLETSRGDLLEEGIKNCQIVLASPLAGSSQKGETNQIIASVYVKKEKFDEALAYLENARAFSPNDPNLLIGFANLYIAKKDYLKAQGSAQKAIEIDPLKTVAYRALAYSFLMEKNYAQAEKNALKGLEVIDKDPSLLSPDKSYYRQQFNYTLADAYTALGDQANADKYKKLGDATN
jgi:tetratricopeptide (TPR) repeat protein